MGRPKQHNARTGEALLAAAERIVEQDGLAALTVRSVAQEVGTTTRAVYSVFGSKVALVAALGARAFDWLARELDAIALTDDPVADLVEVGAGAFRRLATEHPSLFRIGIQQIDIASDLAGTFRAASDNALTRLQLRIDRLSEAGMLADHGARDTTCEFHALCEGLAAIELRGSLGPDNAERIWRDALNSLVIGFAAPVNR